MANKPTHPRVLKPSGHLNGAIFGYVNGVLRAKFFYESDAKEWLANDPYNHGTIGELVERFVIPEAEAASKK